MWTVFLSALCSEWLVLLFRNAKESRMRGVSLRLHDLQLHALPRLPLRYHMFGEPREIQSSSLTVLRCSTKDERS
jgi:hypothetical protein